MKRAHPTIRTVLLVESDEPTIEDVTAVLGKGVRLIAARTGREAIERLATADAHLVLLTSSLPDMDVLDLCRRVRAFALSPLVFVGGSDSEPHILATYAAGADGYIPKPYRLRELDARIQAALRRAPAAHRYESAAVTVGHVTLSLASHEVRVRGSVVRMPLREFELLSVLLAGPGKTWSRGALMRRVWGETPPSGTKSLDVHVRRIRGRIEDDPTRPTRILTIRGVGYQYAVSAMDEAAADRSG